MAWGLSEIHLGRVRLRAEDVAEAVVDASSVEYLLCSYSYQHGRKKEEYLVYMDMVVPEIPWFQPFRKTCFIQLFGLKGGIIEL